MRYYFRSRLAKDFDKFEQEANLTDGQARAILLVLYDYQEVTDAIREDSAKARIDALLEDGEHNDTSDLELLDQADKEMERRIFAILKNDRQKDAWLTHCAMCPARAQRGALRLEGNQPTP